MLQGYELAIGGLAEAVAAARLRAGGQDLFVDETARRVTIHHHQVCTCFEMTLHLVLTSDAEGSLVLGSLPAVVCW